MIIEPRIRKFKSRKYLRMFESLLKGINEIYLPLCSEYLMSNLVV